MLAFWKAPSVASAVAGILDSLVLCMANHVEEARQNVLAVFERVKSVEPSDSEDDCWAQSMRFLHASSLLPQEVMGTRHHFDEVQNEALQYAATVKAQTTALASTPAGCKQL
uniref:Uncharacterized protein n=1 Tax=Eutreptiella gymnastica TaxID=73025 RepID=A0A7S1N7A8_9EUGL